MAEPSRPATTPRIWQVGALCRAIADSLEARFNPVAVRGEISAFTAASSGHCYFSLKDQQGQIRCAMFRRAAQLLEFRPREGDSVEVLGRLGVYEPRGDLQLIVESMRPAGQGALYEQFLRLKARLEAEGLFEPGRKRPVPVLPRGIGIVTSPGAAALHDVVTALRRRACHVPVVLAPAAVQGAQAPGELVQALQALYRLAQAGTIDVILLVRGGGSIEDLWAFNDERLARAIVASPVPLICGVGHETDFTIADFCADLRAPTPTAAAELAAQARETWLEGLAAVQERLDRAVARRLDLSGERLDQAASRLGRPLARMAAQQARLGRAAHRLRFAVHRRLEADTRRFMALDVDLQGVARERLRRGADALERARLRLDLLDPRLVLQRGYALLADASGKPVTSVARVHAGQPLVASVADGDIPVTVTRPCNPS
ncbi:exodeoxyribonuclease VII large subunit [Ramlibacter sp. RBP-2]|uniref:Exodeoxyribonuclease 7 large subunit n=1 Tax=Ramlibacter lithotrophicus TaxID=2606681 RepID=A0A7X6I510_9BURK|nr:exodeoxyribonuclease VII large subunit [Ramlibacter lithotrophicus]NKE64705.1 exodeoxyribonuclease VII large subunit [Ramlibacter lithotrophicus]